MIYYFFGGAGENAEYPRQIDNRRPSAYLVHVQDSRKQTLAGASDVRKSMGGAGGLKAVLDLAGRADVAAAGSEKCRPGLAVCQFLAHGPEHGRLLFVLLADIISQRPPERTVDVGTEGVTLGNTDLQDALINGRSKKSSD